MLSLRTRLLLAASAVLLVFIALCGLGLEQAFRDTALTAEQDRLQGLVYALLGAAEADEGGKLALGPDAVPEPRLRRPDSGLEAAIFDESGKPLWQSQSASGAYPLVPPPQIGQWQFMRTEEINPRFEMTFAFRWIGLRHKPHLFTIVVLDDTSEYDDQLSLFRRRLWAWLAGAAVSLLVTLLLVLQWGVAPLRRLTGELRSVEAGLQPQIESPYPAEISPVTGALNAMIRSERSQIQRYRDALGDLAHSLKTPLAVLRGLTGAPAADAARTRQEQLDRMQQIIDHQLARAAAAGRRTLSQPVAIEPVVSKVEAAMRKVYGDKGLRFDANVPPTLRARVDAGDLYELLGNTLDNAGKWAKQRVRCGASNSAGRLQLVIEDDGPGFPDDADRLLGRGVKADSRTPGQGLGLAAVAEIVRAYEGSIELTRSADLGGARVALTLPVG